MKTPERILVAFASGSDDLIETLLENFQQVAPELPMYVVAEFAPPSGRWIPWFVTRTLEQNRARLADALKGKEVVYAAILLQPRMPYWPMRLAGLLLAPRRLLCFNENLDHFALHPRALPSIVRHMWWRTKNLLRWELRPGGWTYTQVWRIFHPWSYKRQVYSKLALAAGARAALMKEKLAPNADPDGGPARPDGITVVVPSRSGRELLGRLMPGLIRELEGIPHEVIVSDNGSDDETAEWLRAEYPEVLLEVNPDPLSFAEAVNRGIRRASFSHTCLLNNDMVLEPGFFAPLRAAFDRVPDLFCATAQIFFPEGVRREETGKAIWWTHGPAIDFPVWCDTPVEGEDLSYVLYGSGGCSLYDTAKLLQAGCVGEVFQPAYVEDLDLGYRGWVRGWPTVFVAGAKLVHHHRSTTKRFFTEEQIQAIVEVNYLRFLGRSVADPAVFRRLWRRAIERLNLFAAQDPPMGWVFPTLKAARQVTEWVEAPPPRRADEELALALATGDAVSYPGRARDPRKPLVVVASSYVPFPLSHGGAVRIYNLMKGAAAEYDQVLIAFCDEQAAPAAEILALCHEVVLVRREGTHLMTMTERPEVVEEHDSPVFRAALREMIRKHGPAVVQLEFTQMALYARDCGTVPTVLVEHDVTLDLYSQLLREHGDWETEQQLTRWQRFERQAWRDVACVVTMSEKDRGMVEGARRVAVLPNGVDLDRFQPSADSPEPGRILFIGSFAHLPNLLALDFFLREAWPALAAEGATLHIISGSRAEHYQELYQDRVKVDLAQPGIELEGFVSDVRTAYRRAEVVIAPLLASAGTNIKIMEAMAMAKAIVSTPAGINGLDLHPGTDVLVVQDGAQMAAGILGLMRDGARRRAMERAARRTVEARYGWDVVAAAQSALYRSLLNEPQRG